MAEDIKTVEETKEESKEKNLVYRWFIISTASGKERIVKDYIETRKENLKLTNIIKQILLVEEETVTFKKDREGKVVKDENGKPIEVIKIKNAYPRYLFIEMAMTDEAWYVIRNTPNVTGFIGSHGHGSKPRPVSNREMDTVLKKAGIYVVKDTNEFKVGDKAKVLSGPFANTIGTVIRVITETNEIVISSNNLGKTQIFANPSEVEKL